MRDAVLYRYFIDMRTDIRQKGKYFGLRCSALSFASSFWMHTQTFTAFSSIDQISLMTAAARRLIVRFAADLCNDSYGDMLLFWASYIAPSLGGLLRLLTVVLQPPKTSTWKWRKWISVAGFMDESFCWVGSFWWTSWTILRESNWIFLCGSRFNNSCELL